MFDGFADTARDKQDKQGQNLLHHVCKHRNEEVLALLKKDKDVFEKLMVTGDKKKQYPVTMVSSDHPEFLENIYQVRIISNKKRLEVTLPIYESLFLCKMLSLWPSINSL